MALRLWSRAAEISRQTPESRNRYVDFLRALSIGAVVYGHWTAAAPWVTPGGDLSATHMLAVSPWTRWLTWCIQVMPVFFIVGGYSNGISWRASVRDGKTYRIWLDARLRRLVGPVLALVAAWAVLGFVGLLLDLPADMVQVGSRIALIPLWFLAVYLMVAVLVPVTHAAWERWKMASFLTPVAAAMLIDVAFFAGGLRWIGWLNHLFVWSAVHQLGYAWRDGYFERVGRCLAWSAAGLAALAGLMHWGPYPISMVGVPGQEIGNTSPPKITLIALACLQGGLLLALQAPLRRWLAGAIPWTATVLVNGMIMTVYLWHMTAMVLIVGLIHAVGDPGLHLKPGTSSWWATRPLWLALLTLALLPFVSAFAHFERPKPAKLPAVAAWRLVIGALLVCAGLALMALDGVGGGRWPGFRVGVVALPFAGALLMGQLRFAVGGTTASPRS